ncbi:farnesol dehydrogenase-like isoform X1 [Anopheles arabiensis]|uniref:Dehydrogenase/reductase SDR family member 11 precursor n=9 Tax=gambiae species complex TaxID=44542 RepID=A0ABK8FUU3_ANOGA|nr:farnesol dehydrogenase-like isoform X1 [Anopheles arabiensis]XP_040167105.1 farnesol dehydrogenase-like isoform X1 [Anopheles arabiensis]XP_040167106.1 farnesol dehydrogenase-like isoform X1 [Anopheles arabiensis]XP_040167107.1 farnesol dehydrogenase-like isoform X1 [Anopheles arabiensis]XP_040167108.1 farnesol dehydrogenase-like isoform X1 [Anopheles arabiensis]XP_061514618.1 farnesol dehydrogenase isoform X1 [Anopheles gambiae]XP_061514619.1 farnesol dehydrogenase isoform X1 [Anopheles g
MAANGSNGNNDNNESIPAIPPPSVRLDIADRMKRWHGKVAVVTGASGAIGGAIAIELVKSGMIVCALSRRRDKVEKLRVSLFDVAGSLNYVECDITVEDDIKYAFGWIENTYGGVDMLVNNAGIITKCLLTEKNNTRDLYKTMETNIIGLSLCTREAVKSMKARDVKGHIINVNSIFGHKVHQAVPGTRPLNGMYPASKYAVTAITECIRQELVYLGTGCKVTSISPGLVEGDILSTNTSKDNEIVNYMPKLKPEDVAEAVLYAITTPENVQIHELIIKPMGEFL